MKDILLKNGFVSLSEEQAQQFAVYKELLLEKNRDINLTSITDEKEIAYKHFLDCVSPLKYADFKNKAVIDVGTGAGFPGLPVKITEPTVRLTLLDSLNKRVDFLKEIVKTLDLKDVSCIHARAEDAAKELRESYDFALSRAVAELNVLCEYCLPFVRVGGYMIALKGPSPEEELKGAEKAIDTLGGIIENIYSYTLSDFTHTLIFIKKIKPTPTGYPRNSSKIKKKPL